MIDITIVTEDALSEAMVRRLLNETNPDFNLIASYPNYDRLSASGGFGYIESRLHGFCMAAKRFPFLVLLDLDTRECAPKYRAELLPNGKTKYLILRIAVREVESWILADREAMSAYLGITKRMIPLHPDEVADPKRELFKLVRRSRYTLLRQAILPKDVTASVGPDYNGELIRFLGNKWHLDRALNRSPSLQSAIDELKIFSYP